MFIRKVLFDGKVLLDGKADSSRIFVRPVHSTDYSVWTSDRDR